MENDLFRYSNSKAMVGSLKTALTEIDVVKKRGACLQSCEISDGK
ncbi:hypothetical protein [Bartonella gliris]|nr:hypothetical protein [Bartonella gliris]